MDYLQSWQTLKPAKLGESPKDYALRMAKNFQPNDYLFGLLGQCFGLETQEVLGAAQGTLVVTEEQFLEIPQAQRFLNFVSRLEKTASRVPAK